MLTTHDMEDISALCSRVMVLGHGQKLFDGKLPELLERFDTVRTVVVKYNTENPKLVLPAGVVKDKKDDEIHITYSPADIPTADMLAILQNAGTISEMTLQSENIDHLIAAMYKEMDL